MNALRAVQRRQNDPGFVPPPIVDIGPMLAIGIAELREKHCRWPAADATEDEPMRYCGRDSPEGKPYCAAHATLAYSPRHARRDA